MAIQLNGFGAKEEILIYVLCAQGLLTRVEQSMIVFALFPLGQSQSKRILPGPPESLDGELFSLGGKKVGNHGRQIELI